MVGAPPRRCKACARHVGGRLPSGVLWRHAQGPALEGSCKQVLSLHGDLAAESGVMAGAPPRDHKVCVRYLRYALGCGTSGERLRRHTVTLLVGLWMGSTLVNDG